MLTFLSAYDLALKIEFLHVKIVDQSGARSPKADDVEPKSPEIFALEPWSPAFLRPEPWSPKPLWDPDIYLKHTSHILPVAGLGVGDAALFVVGVVVHGVTLAIENQIKNEINREIL